MSSSWPDAEPDLSIVVGSNHPGAPVEGCLESLESQVDSAEVLVCEPEASPERVRRRFSWAQFHERRGALVPGRWRDGIERSRGAIAALTISPMRPAPDWVATIRDQLDRRDVVAGAIEPGPSLRISDWGEYFCRYARDMLPFAAHDCPELPGDNAAYKRTLLERTRDLYADGFWEPVVNRRLRDEGVVLWHAPELVVRQGRSAGSVAFARQRLVHGRVYGRQRGAGFGTVRNAAGVAAAPAVAGVLPARIAREVARRRRLRLRAAAALPAILFFNGAWAVGEAAGHLDVLLRR